MKHIPVIDIAPFRSGGSERRQQIARQVAEVCRQVGFLLLTGHGLPAGDLERAFALTRQFTDLPQAVKDRWRPSGPSKQRGYHAFATRGLANTLDRQVPPDLRETIFLGPVDDHSTHYAGLPEAQNAYWPNTIPNQPPGLEDALTTLYRDFEHLSIDLLRLFAAALSLPEDYFTDKIDRHFSVMSCHHYPALSEPPEPGQLRTGAHTDFGAMTILAMTEASGGLEVELADGSWLPVQAKPGELVINLGDMMARWTNDRWTSTLHRVVNPPELADRASRRQSIGYFMHPNFDARIDCIPTCLAADETARYPAITAGEHIAMKIDKSHMAGPIGA